MHADAWDVRGKVAIVSGATSGIGKETALGLAQRGARVTLAVRDVEAGNHTASWIRAQCTGAIVDVGPPLDLAQPESIAAFVAGCPGHGGPLHVLVNNAGANYLVPWKTPGGVPGLVQVNHLGPYHLTRLLEGRLAAGAPSRVVSVSSVTHRYGWIGNAADFLRRTATGVGQQYPSTKLANVLFAYELQRRLGPFGVQAAAVDPGAVATRVYRGSWLLGSPLAQAAMRIVYAPPRDGAAAVLHACCAPWGSKGAAPPASQSARHAKGSIPGSQAGPAETPPLRYFARGVFALPAVTCFAARPPARGRLGALHMLRTLGWALPTLALSATDWPLRCMSRGRLLSRTVLALSSPQSYDPELAAALWDLSADAVGVPRGVLGMRRRDRGH